MLNIFVFDAISLLYTRGSLCAFFHEVPALHFFSVCVCEWSGQRVVFFELEYDEREMAR